MDRRLLVINLLLAVGVAEAAQHRQRDDHQSPAAPPPSPLPPAPPSCTPELRRSIVWGGATSAYQIEGAWDADGKGPSIWDTFTHKGGETQGNATGDVANDHYRRFKEDVLLMKQLGVKTYRFSVAWARVVPTGLAGSPVNRKGLEFYKSLVAELLAAGITPAVTMFHWDLPQGLQDAFGGFLDPSPGGARFAEAFEYYADVLFKELGPSGVRLWMTFNEPLSICDLGYSQGIFAPGVKRGEQGQFKCGHNLLLAHAAAYRLFERKYKAQQGGKVSIPLDGKWGFPYNADSAADKRAADDFMVFQYGWMADPLYFGDYPLAMRRAFSPDVLPRFTPAQSTLVNGTVDYFALQFYCGYFVKSAAAAAAAAVGNGGAGAGAGGGGGGAAAADGSPSYYPNRRPYEVSYTGPDGRPVGPPSASAWLFSTPPAIRLALRWLDARYSGAPGSGRQKVEFTVSENGVSGPGEATAPLPAVLDDRYRLDYYQGYLDNLCRAVSEDGVRLSTYWAWSVFDNFEWREAYTQRFGLVYIDLRDGLRRVPKKSAYWFKAHFYSQSARHDASYFASSSAATSGATKARGRLPGAPAVAGAKAI